MSPVITRFPATVRFDRTDGGGFRAEFVDLPAEPVEAPTLDELLDRLRLILAPAVAPEEAGPDEDDPGGPDFDAELEYVLRKNAELYRRLAQ